MAWGTGEGTVLDCAFPGVSEVTVKRLQVSQCRREGAIPLPPAADRPVLSLLPAPQPPLT